MRNSVDRRTQIITVIFCLGLSILSAGEIRGVWAPVWEMETPAKIDAMVKNVAEHNGNLILAEARYRSDAAYTPNRYANRWMNHDPRCYMIDGDFDPLDYLIERADEYDIAVYAWFTVLVATSHEMEYTPAQHVYYQHPEWVTRKADGRPMTPPETEGAFLDPGVPEVHEYLINVIMDVVTNYAVDGVQLDYIRYPGAQYGFHPVSRERWRERYQSTDEESWQRWKEEQVTQFVRRCYAEIKAVRPSVEVTASVVSDIDTARGKYAQDWPTWLREGYLDRAYLMSYQESDDAFERVLNNVDFLGFNDRIVVGLRAWRNHSRYPASRIVSKIDILRRHGYAGLSLFSYDGLVQNGYYNSLVRGSMQLPERYEGVFDKKGVVLGQVYGADGEPVEGATVTIGELEHITTTDANGFFAAYGVEPGTYAMRVLAGDEAIDPPPVIVSHPAQAVRVELSFAPTDGATEPPDFVLEGFREDGRAVLMWRQQHWAPISVYRRSEQDGLFELADILLDSVNVWVDESVDNHVTYDYKIITVEEKSSEPLSLKPVNGERPMRAKFFPEVDGYRIELHLPLADKLVWSLETEIGEPLVSAEGWYPGGLTVERWNGATHQGAQAKAGVYRFRCRSLLRDWDWSTFVYLPSITN